MRNAITVGTCIAVVMISSGAPAWGASAWRNDPRGDVRHYDYTDDAYSTGADRYDLLGVGVAHRASDVKVTIEAREVFAGTWTLIDTDSDRAAEYLVTGGGFGLTPPGVGLSGLYRRGATRWVDTRCDFGETYKPSASVDRMIYRIPRSCLGKPRLIRVKANYAYESGHHDYPDAHWDSTRWTTRAARS